MHKKNEGKKWNINNSDLRISNVIYGNYNRGRVGSQQAYKFCSFSRSYWKNVLVILQDYSAKQNEGCGKSLSGNWCGHLTQGHQ